MKLLDGIQLKGKYQFMFEYAYQKIGKRPIFISSPPLHLTTARLTSCRSPPLPAAPPRGSRTPAVPLQSRRRRDAVERRGEAEGCGAAAEGRGGARRSRRARARSRGEQERRAREKRGRDGAGGQQRGARSSRGAWGRRDGYGGERRGRGRGREIEK